MVVSSADQFVATCDHLTDYVFVGFRNFDKSDPPERPLLQHQQLYGAAEYRHCRVPALDIHRILLWHGEPASLALAATLAHRTQNFIDFEALNNNVNYFWKVAGPCTVLFFVVVRAADNATTDASSPTRTLSLAPRRSIAAWTDGNAKRLPHTPLKRPRNTSKERPEHLRHSR